MSKVEKISALRNTFSFTEYDYVKNRQVSTIKARLSSPNYSVNTSKTPLTESRHVLGIDSDNCVGILSVV